jgi:hypothetical protein
MACKTKDFLGYLCFIKAGLFETKYFSFQLMVLFGKSGMLILTAFMSLNNSDFTELTQIMSLKAFL